MSPQNRKYAVIVVVALAAGVVLGMEGRYFTSPSSVYSGANDDIAPVSTTSSVIISSGSSTPPDNTNTIDIANTAPESPAPVPAAVIDTNGWKTYSNYELGFSLQYPADFTLDTSNLSAVTVLFPLSADTFTVSVVATCPEAQSSSTLLYETTHEGACYVITHDSQGSDAVSIASTTSIINGILSTFTFIDTPSGENEAEYSSGEQTVSEGIINLSSVAPSPVSVGGNLLLTGSGFSGYDTIVWISNGSVKAVLWGGMPSSDTSITAAVPSQACTQYIGASGLACPSYLILNPGVYAVDVSNQNGTTDQSYIKVQ